MRFSSNIEDYPFIIRFKTLGSSTSPSNTYYIEDYPFIIRFKTSCYITSIEFCFDFNIEDYPFIIRFKTNAIMGAKDLHSFLSY